MKTSFAIFGAFILSGIIWALIWDGTQCVLDLFCL